MGGGRIRRRRITTADLPMQSYHVGQEFDLVIIIFLLILFWRSRMSNCNEI